LPQATKIFILWNFFIGSDIDYSIIFVTPCLFFGSPSNSSGLINPEEELSEIGVSLPSEYDVIVAGAGIVGASVAWHSSRKGLKVALLDASGPAAAATGASDGAVSVASKRPGIMAELAGLSLSYCSDLSQPGKVLSGVFHNRPSYFFSRNDVENEALGTLQARLANADYPVSVERDGPAGSATVPGLGANVSRVLELSGEGHMLGYRATRSFLADSDITCHWPCRLEAFEVHQGKVTIQTGQGEMRAGKLVLATGMGTARLVPELSLVAKSGQLIVTDAMAGSDWQDIPGPLTSAAYLLDKSSGSHNESLAPVVIDPLATGQLLIGSSREVDGDERQTDFHTVRRILAAAVASLPALARRRITRVFAGVRTASPDGFPIVGEMPGMPEVVVATGFEGDGICLAPLIGREVAELISGGRLSRNLDTLSPSRFHSRIRASS
jgi:glycine/D-amino acid oxidase-like deaminating enzyme